MPEEELGDQLLLWLREVYALGLCESFVSGTQSDTDATVSTDYETLLNDSHFAPLSIMWKK